ncbi:MAG: acyltransferase family protein [Fusobacterium sp.]|nr:acyltransferase family protein [Fusobacterium sp.]
MEIQKRRNTGIDVLKALSVISVIIYHLYEFKGTYIGVVVFFVISGYFISSVLMEREESYFQFIKKRFSKIYPLLTVILAIVCGIFFLFNGFLSKKMLYNSIFSFLGLSNIYQIFSGMSYFERSGDMYPLLHTWTLAIEIQFYLFYPFLIYSFKKLKLKNKNIAIILFLLSLVSVFIMFYKYISGHDLSALYYGTDTRIFSLFIGGVYYFLFKEKEINIKKMNIFASISLILLILSIFLVDYSMEENYLGLLYFLSVLSGIIVIATIKGDFLSYNNKFFKLLGNLGKHSYCYYLWQYPIMVFINEYFKWSNIKYSLSVLLQILILIIIAEISYILLEERVKMAKILQRIFLFIYLGLIFFLPISEESNSKIIEERMKEVNIEMQINKMNKDTEESFKKQDSVDEIANQNEILKEIKEIESIDNFEKRLLGLDEGTIKIEPKLPVKKEIEQIETKKLPLQENIKKENKEIEAEVKEKSINTQAQREPKQKKDELKMEATLDSKKYIFIGDSVMKGAQPFLAKIFTNSIIDAKESRQFTHLPKILEQLKKENKLTDRVVIHLGTNGLITEKAFQKSMEILNGKKVYFINAIVPKHWEESVNRDLKEWSKKYENVKIIDWHKKAKGKKDLFYKDAVHPNKVGAKLYAEFIHENL